MFISFVFNSPGIAVMTLIIVLLSDLLMRLHPMPPLSELC